MAERSTISQVVQIGVESTPGTSVAANKRLQSLSIEPTLNTNINRFRPQGSKFETVAALGKEWASAPVSGIATYDEIIYPLSSVLTAGVHTTLAGGGEEWVFSPATFAADAPKTFTIEYGSAVRAHKLTYGLFQEFGIEINRDAVNLSGSLMGQRITDGITLTSSPSSIPLVPMLPTSFDVYVDPLFANIGTTKLGRALSLNWRIGSRSNPLWVIDSTKTSWVAHVETVPTLEMSLLVEADADGMAFLTQLRNGGTSFARIVSTGGTIPGETDVYSFQLDMPTKIVNTGGFSDQDGVYAVEWQTTGVHDDGLGGALQATVVNSRATL
jgi:hypothetical protein